MKLFSYALLLMLTCCSSVQKTESTYVDTKINPTDPDFAVEVTKYSCVQNPVKSILILPPTGGTNILDRSYAKNLCENGFEVYILNRWTNDDEKSFDLDIHNRFYGRAQRAIGLVLSQVKTPFVGLLGTSVGALFGAIAAGYHERLDAVFLITGGAPIASIIVNSDQGAMKEAKKKRFAIYKFKTDEEYLKALDEAIILEPFKLPALFKKKYLGMIVAEDDTTVPYQFQLTLKDYWNPQVVYSFKNGHMMAILKSWFWHKKDIISFFETAASKKI